MRKTEEQDIGQTQSGVKASAIVRRFTRFSLWWLLVVVAVMCVVFAIMRALTPPPTPKSIIQEARIGLIRMGGDTQPHAFIMLGDETNLTRATINALVAYDKERPIRGVIFKRQSIQGLDVELMRRLKQITVVTVRDARVIAPDCLVAMPTKDKLIRLVFFDCDLTGLEFPPNLPLTWSFHDGA